MRVLVLLLFLSSSELLPPFTLAGLPVADLLLELLLDNFELSSISGETAGFGGFTSRFLFMRGEVVANFNCGFGGSVSLGTAALVGVVAVCGASAAGSGAATAGVAEGVTLGAGSVAGPGTGAGVAAGTAGAAVAGLEFEAVTAGTAGGGGACCGGGTVTTGAGGFSGAYKQQQF